MCHYWSGGRGVSERDHTGEMCVTTVIYESKGHMSNKTAGHLETV